MLKNANKRSSKKNDAKNKTMNHNKIGNGKNDFCDESVTMLTKTSKNKKSENIESEKTDFLNVKNVTISLIKNQIGVDILTLKNINKKKKMQIYLYVYFVIKNTNTSLPYLDIKIYVQKKSTF